MADVIEYRIEIDVEIFQNFAPALKLFTGPSGYALKILLAVLVGGCLLFWILASSLAEPEAVATARWFGVGGLLFGTVTSFLAIVAMEFRQMALMEDALTMQGPLHVRIDELGIVANSAGADYVYRWAAVADVVEMEKGLCFSIFGSSFVPLPDEYLPQGLSRDAALADINQWRGS